MMFINFFFYYKFYVDYFGLFGSIFFNFNFIKNFLLYFYYFLYKFFSFMKLINLLIFNFSQLLIQKLFVFGPFWNVLLFKQKAPYFLFFTLYFLKAYLLFFFFYLKSVFVYIYDNVRLCIEFFIPRIMLYLQQIDYNFYLVVCWNFFKSKVSPVKKHFWNFFNW